MADVCAERRGAIILCGGRSARMGRDKSWLPFGPDEVMLPRVVRLVSDAVPADNIVCVAAAEQQLPQLPESVQVIRDADPYSGPLAGLVAGLAVIASRADAVFASGCDVPLLMPAFVLRLFEHLGDHQIAVPRDSDRIHPLAAVYRTSVLSPAQPLLASGERRLSSLIDCCHSHYVDVDKLRDADPELLSLANCNTLDDYQRAFRLSGFSD